MQLTLLSQTRRLRDVIFTRAKVLSEKSIVKIEYQLDIEVKLRLKSLAALTFLPSNEVRTVFDTCRSFPDEDKFNEILIYFFSM